jgi:hypothetical protein
VYRIDNASAVPTLPLVPPTYVPGFFTDGNPASGAEATILDAWWLNMVQEEVLAVVEAAGLPPDKADNTQLYQAIQAIAQAANPDLSAYLPLAGGTLSGPGNLVVAGNFTVTSGRGVIRSGGWPSLVLYNTVDSLASGYAIGAGSGVLRLGVNDGNGVPINGLQVQSDGGVVCMQGFVSTGNATFLAIAQVNGNLNVSGGFIVKPDSGALQLTGGGGANMADLTLGANTITARGLLAASSLQSAGDFSVGGTSYLAGINAGSTTVDGNLVVNYNASLGSANIHGHCQGNTWQFGSGTVIGNLDCGGDGSFANITGHNQVVTNYFRCTTADIQGNTVIGGQLDINGGGFIYAINRCYRGYEINLDPGGIFSAAHGASYQGGPWNTALVLHTRAEAIEPYEHGLAALRQLQPMIYSERRLIGIASEDYRDPMPEMIVHLEVEDDGIAAALRTEPAKTVEGFNGGALTYALVNAVKELADRLDALEDAWPAPAPA